MNESEAKALLDRTREGDELSDDFIEATQIFIDLCDPEELAVYIAECLGNGALFDAIKLVLVAKPEPDHELEESYRAKNIH